MSAHHVDVLAFRLENSSCHTVIEGMDVPEELINVITHRRGLKDMSAELFEDRAQIVLSPTTLQKRMIAQILLGMVSDRDKLARMLGMPGDLDGALELYRVEDISRAMVSA